MAAKSDSKTEIKRLKRKIQKLDSNKKMNKKK